MKKSTGKGRQLGSMREIWTAVDESTWLDTLKEICPTGKWTRKGNHISGCCQWHSDANPSFIVTPSRGVAKCFSCNKVVTDPVDLLAKASGTRTSYVLSTIVETRWGVRINAKVSERLRLEQEDSNSRLALINAMRKTLLAAVENIHEEEWSYAAPAVAMLIRRGVDLTPANLRRLPIGIMPTKAHLSKFTTDRGLFERAMEIAGPYFWFSDPNAKHQFTGSVAFFYSSAPEAYSAVKLRHARHKDFMFIAQGIAEHRGVYGLDLCAALISLDQANSALDNRALLVEGEFDCLMCHLKEGPLPSAAWMGVSGNGMDTEMHYLADAGFTSVGIVADNDKGGIGITQRLLESIDTEVAVFAGDQALWGSCKDVDDLCQAGRYPALRAAIGNDTSWLSRSAWVAQRLKHEAAAARTLTISDQERLCDSWLKCFPGTAETMTTHRARLFELVKRDGYIEENIAAAFFRDGREAGEMLLQLRAAIDRTIYPLYTMRGHEVVCYSVASGRTFVVDFGTTPTKRLAALKLHGLPVGRTLEQWVQDEVGIPAWFRSKASQGDGETASLDPVSFNKKLTEHADLALEIIMTGDLPEQHNVKTAFGGIHYYGWDGDAVMKCNDLTSYIYAVNGGKAYAGAIRAETVDWTEITIPVHNTISFVTSGDTHGDLYEHWSENIKSIEDLRSTPQYTPASLFATLKKVIQAGWVFADGGETNKEVQDLESTYLAAVMMTSGCVCLFPKRNQTFITAERSSGKSKFMTMCSRRDPVFGLVEQGQYYEDFTVAGVSQSVKNRKPFLCVDEFESNGLGSSDENRGRQARGLLEAIRNNYTGFGGAVRGTPSGEAVIREFAAGVLLAGINPITNDADITRFIFVALKHVDGMVESPEDRIFRVIRQDDLPKIRRAITLFGVHYAPQILQSVAAIKASTNKFSTEGIEHANRYGDLMLPVYAMLHLAGVDVAAFAKRYTPLKARNFSTLAPENKGQLLRRIATTPIRQSLPDGVGRTLAQLAASPSHRSLLVTLGLGLYVVTAKEKGVQTELAVLYIPQLIESVLATHGYKTASLPTIYRELSTHPKAWSADRAAKADVPRALRFLLRFGNMESTTWVAFPLDALAAEINEATGAADIPGMF